MLRRKSIHIIIFLLLIHFFNDPTWATDWGFRGMLPRGTGYYDKSSIKKIKEDIRQVWTVTIYNDKGKADALSLLKKQNKAPGNFEIIHQESTLLEFDCARGKFRIVSINIFDEEGNVLLAIPEIDAQWNEIIPNSVNEKLKNIVCSKYQDRS